MIKSLSLKNFKCFQSNIDVFFSKINLLTGSNGRGKSSLLQALLLLAQSYENGRDFKNLRLSGRFLDLGVYKDVVYKGDKNAKISISITTDNEEKDGNKIDFVCKCANQDGIETLIDDILINEKSIVSAFGTSKASNSDESDKSFVPTSTYDCFLQLSNVYYVSAEREGPRNAVQMKESSVNDQIGVHGELVANLLYEKKEDFQQKVAEALSYVLGGASVHVTSTDLDFIRIFLDSVDGSEGFKPVNVGFGYSYILPLVVLPLIIPNGSKLFIENPEAHLHPGAQSRIMDYLLYYSKQKNIQLFIETHSDHVINSLRIAAKEDMVKATDARIIHVGREEISFEPHIWQIELDEDGNLSDYPKEFLDEWGNQMAKLV